jgi:hypothetical protein
MKAGRYGFLLFSASLRCDIVAAAGQKHAGRSARATQKGITTEAQRKAFRNKGLTVPLSVCLSRNVSYLKRISKG